MQRVGLSQERLATSASFLDVGVVEDEFGRPAAAAHISKLSWVQRAARNSQSIILPIHLTANDAEERLAVDQNCDTILLHLFIKFARLVWRDIFKVITHSSTAFVADANADQLRASWCL